MPESAPTTLTERAPDPNGGHGASCPLFVQDPATQEYTACPGRDLELVTVFTVDMQMLMCRHHAEYVRRLEARCLGALPGHVPVCGGAG